ncbi:MAG: SpoIIE family protein phosphatase [Thermomicrobiales bacterium]|nr:SpoIIE family protein phosphatase [Thermomicrobiales bacterium]
MTITIEIAIAKTNKYASRESGDTVEIVERPGGGMSVILADGQGSGRAAKSLSLQITAKVAALLKEGVRDGAAARAANDYLFAVRHGQVSSTLDILSVDLKTNTVAITRNGDTACIIGSPGGLQTFREAERRLGLHHRTRPWTTEQPIVAGTWVLLLSDGVANAGMRHSLNPWALADIADLAAEPQAATELADTVLAEAVRRDQGKPGDDMSVVALTLRDREPEGILIRRMSAEVPIS